MDSITVYTEIHLFDICTGGIREKGLRTTHAVILLVI